MRLLTYQALIALLAHFGADTADFPDIAPLGLDWQNDIWRIALADYEEAERQKRR